MRAMFASICVLCDQDIDKGEAIVPHRGGYIHRHCASGYADE